MRSSNQDGQKARKKPTLSFRAVYCICALLLLLLSAGSFAMLLRYIRPTAAETTIRLAAAVSFLLPAAILIAIYCLIINPITKLEKVLNGAIQHSAEESITTLDDSPLLSSIFSNLQAVIDRMETLMLRESNAQLMKKQAELDILQSQINPHFLYNTLDTIRGQAHIAGQDNIEAMALALSKLFRYSISSYDTLVSLEEELQAVKNYFLIQNFRFDNKFIAKYEIDDDTLTHKVPKMLIQPLVENAILHGLEPKLGKGAVIIKAYKTKSRLVINVDDDGVGILPARLTEINDALFSNVQQHIKKNSRTSIGLYNINSRIRMIYGPAYHISISSVENIGTNVQLSLPLTS